MACDPETHRRHEAPKEFDVCFVGNLMPGPRSDLIRLIQQQFKNCYVGQAYFEEMARIYSVSRIVFNRSVKNDLNMRVFEALASGSLLVTNDLTDNGQAELFSDGKQLATYRDGHELLDKLRYYLNHDDVRERIAAAGREEALAKHTYERRMQEVLRVVSERRRVATLVPTDEALASGAKPFAPVRENKPGGATAKRPRNENSTAQSLPYFEFARPELLDRIPVSAMRVLEIGCGTGRLGEALKKRQPCEVVGIEMNPQAAEKARERLDRVVVGDVERLDLDFEDGAFDCLVCGDVLEHLIDPAEFLRQARSWLAPGAAVVASIPNVRHHSVVGSLIEGNWTYEPAGLLDSTHLHFFTRRGVEDLFADAGYSIEQIHYVPGPGYDEWTQQEEKGRVQLGRLALSGLAQEDAAEFFVYQFLINAAPKSELSPKREGAGRRPKNTETHRPGSHGSIDSAGGPNSLLIHGGQEPIKRLPRCLLLMVTYNRLEYTRLALDAALELDYPDLQIVVWDNASTDGTVEYVRNRLAGAPHAELIASDVNRGVVFPMNEVWGMHKDAELLAKIDNDTLVPPELLKRLAECHGRSERFGVLSGFHFREEGEALAQDSWIKSFDGVQILPQPYVGGCAVMIRRKVLEEIGLIGCRTDARQQPFMDSGWTVYQQRLTDQGLVNGYPWPPIHVDHMEDTRSPHCIRSEEHQQYKRDERGMGLEEFTKELCVWRPNLTPGSNGEALRASHDASESATAIMNVERRTPMPMSGGPPSPATMRFRQDFVADFERFDFWGPPFAFARFADGERAICMGVPIQGQDGWSYDGRRSDFAAQLNAALRYVAPDYYLGISDGCCDQPAKEWYLRQIQTPLERLTFSNIFVNANYRRFQQLDVSDMAIVAPEGGDYWAPEDVMNSDFDLDRLVERLLTVTRPILVSAGPASCIIIHKYWQRAAKKQVIVDVGSAIDERTKGRKTRQYQTPGTRTAELVCKW